ncbi:MAG: hypothetical protein ABIQ18_13030, partial [Umezawaea sp.]
MVQVITVSSRGNCSAILQLPGEPTGANLSHTAFCRCPQIGPESTSGFVPFGPFVHWSDQPKNARTSVRTPCSGGAPAGVPEGPATSQVEQEQTPEVERREGDRAE